MTAETQIKLNHAFDQVVFDRTSEARKVLVHPSGFAICRGRSWPLLVTCNPMQAPPKVTDVRMRNAFSFYRLSSRWIMSFDKSSAAAARQRVHRTRLPLDRCPRSRAATANTVFFMARIDRVGEVYSKPAKKPMPAGTPGDGLSQSTAIIRGYAPIPLWSYRHVHTAAVEVRRVKRSNAVELEEQPKKVRARIV